MRLGRSQHLATLASGRNASAVSEIDQTRGLGRLLPPTLLVCARANEYRDGTRGCHQVKSVSLDSVHSLVAP